MTNVRFHSFRSAAPLALLLGLTVSAGIAACGSTGSGDSSSTGNAGQGAGHSSSGEGGSLFAGTGTGGSTATGFEECATSSEEATLVPVNMMIMFDRSGSMEDNNKWDDATAALTAFIQDPESAGLRVALSFFPTNDCQQPSCDIVACSVPDVALGELTADPAPADTHEAVLVSAIADENPNGNHTPIYPALGGADRWAIDYLTANPNEKAVAIFVTDGEPNGCIENATQIAALAADAWTNYGVPTYSVGLEGSEEALMNLIAQEGGTGQAIFISSGSNAEQELLDALKAIQGSQVACEFQMPSSSNGEEIDPKKVNVEYTPGGGMPQTLGQVPDAANCTNGGWYYDDPAAPTSIILCPETCATVQADEQAKIRIVLGCATKPVD